MRDVGCTDECGVDGSGVSKKGHILNSGPTEIAGVSEVNMRETHSTETLAEHQCFTSFTSENSSLYHHTRCAQLTASLY